MTKTKTNKKHLRKPRRTKKQIAHMRRILCILRMFLIGVSIAVVFFNFVLIITGGWDDVDYVSIVIAIALAICALGVALYDMLRYKASSLQVVIPLSLVALTAVFYLVVSLVEAAVVSGVLE